MIAIQHCMPSKFQHNITETLLWVPFINNNSSYLFAPSCDENPIFPRPFSILCQYNLLHRYNEQPFRKTIFSECTYCTTQTRNCTQHNDNGVGIVSVSIGDPQVLEA